MDYSVQIGESFRISSDTDCLVMAPDGYVDAIVDFYADAKQAVAYVYARLGLVPSDTPLPGSGMTGAEYWHLQKTGRYSSKYDLQLSSRARRLFRIEDYAGRVSWMVSFDRAYPGLRFGEVYVCQPNGCVDPKMKVTPPDSFRSLDEFSDYVASRPNALIETYDQIGRAYLDVPDGEEVFLVMDIGGMTRSHPEFQRG